MEHLLLGGIGAISLYLLARQQAVLRVLSSTASEYLDTDFYWSLGKSGFSITGLSTQGATSQPGFIDVLTGGALNDVAFVRYVNQEGTTRYASFNMPMRFRCVFQPLTLTDQTLYAGMGINAAFGYFLGFKIVNDVVYGCQQFNGVDILTPSLGIIDGVDIIGSPVVLELDSDGEKADFYVWKNPNPKLTKEGTLTVSHPLLRLSIVSSFHVKADSEEVKECYLQGMEFWFKTESSVIP